MPIDFCVTDDAFFAGARFFRGEEAGVRGLGQRGGEGLRREIPVEKGLNPLFRPEGAKVLTVGIAGDLL